MDCDRHFVRQIVRETIRELNDMGLMKNFQDISYSQATAVLADYYKNGQKDLAVKSALEKIKGDPYFEIIPMYFVNRFTIERIAEVFDVEVSTISRNKKRLFLEIAKKTLDKSAI